MSDLRFNDKKMFEKIFQTDDTILLFTDNEFASFFKEFNIDIDSEKYYSTDKNSFPVQIVKLRKFWEVESTAVVSQVTSSLLEYALALILQNEHPYRPSTFICEQAGNILSHLDESTLETDSKTLKEKPSSKNLRQKPPTPSSALKACIQVKALGFWKKDQNLMKSDIVKKNEFQQFLNALQSLLGCQVKDDTILKWISEVDPRPPEKKPGPKSR